MAPSWEEELPANSPGHTATLAGGLPPRWLIQLAAAFQGRRKVLAMAAVSSARSCTGRDRAGAGGQKGQR
jgi:hypothetical protein